MKAIVMKGIDKFWSKETDGKPVTEDDIHAVIDQIICRKDDMMRVPATTDMVQEEHGNLEIPEIRVWCHPRKIGKVGDAYYKVFDSFGWAELFIGVTPEAEAAPLIAFRGYELNLWEMDDGKRHD